MFDHVTKQLEDRQKYHAKRRIFNSLLGFCKCDQIRFLLFDVHVLNLDMNHRKTGWINKDSLFQWLNKNIQNLEKSRGKLRKFFSAMIILSWTPINRQGISNRYSSSRWRTIIQVNKPIIIWLNFINSIIMNNNNNFIMCYDCICRTI